MLTARTDAECLEGGSSARPLRHGETTRRIIGAFFHVYHELGFGFLESVYRKALALELTERGLHVQAEAALHVSYKGSTVGVFRADLLVDECVVVELKASQAVTTADRSQLVNYLRCTQLEVGLLLHFGPRPAFLRLIASKEYARRL